MPRRGQTGRQRHSVLNLAICLCICYQTCEHDNLEMSEPISMPFGTSDPEGRDTKRSTLGSGGQR